jgi:energy-coupling factor transport system ATP-binding protein
MLDPQGSQEVFEIIQRLTQAGTTVLIAEHRLEWIARYADRVIALSEGEVILDGAPGEVLVSPLLLHAGMGWLRYTRVAHLGLERGLWPIGHALPVTLEQAVTGFDQAGSTIPGQEQSNVDPG